VPKVGMEPIRRQQLIQATMAAIDEVGLADATVMRIARHAGVSAGIISHYFGGKDGLLEATMRQILHDLGEAVATRRRQLENASPRAHLGAISGANMFIMVSSSALGPVYFSLVERLTDSYRPAIALSLAVPAVLAMATLRTKDPQVVAKAAR